MTDEINTVPVTETSSGYTGSIKSTAFQFNAGNKLVMKITPTGIWVDPGMEVTVAARAVLEALSGMLQQLLENEYQRGLKDGQNGN